MKNKFLLILILPLFLTTTLAQTEWTASIIVVSDDLTIKPIELTFGISPEATKGYDSGIDVPMPPPPPYDVALDAFLACKACLYPRLYTSMKFQELSSWELEVASIHNFTLRWNLVLPQGFNCTLTWDSAKVDMRQKDSIRLSTGNYSFLIKILTTLRGDVIVDCKVDIADLASVGLAFGSKAGDVNWNLNADVVADGVINIFDLVLVGLNYGEGC
jgi:hypothetical protein